MPPPLADPSASLEEFVEADALARLDSLVGRYLRGEILAYRGTASAHDNAGVIGAAAQSDVSDGSIDDGPALGRLEYRPIDGFDYLPRKPDPGGDAAILVIYDAMGQKRIAFSQAKAAVTVTEVSQISDGGYLYSAPLLTSCASCAPNFWSNPKKIISTTS